MESFTIFLDVNDPRREKFFWTFHIIMSVFWILQGLTNLTQTNDWYSWAQVIGGSLAITAMIFYLITLRKFGRRRLIFDDNGIEVKVKQLGESKKISWQDIEHIKIQMNDAEVIQKSSNGQPLKIPFESYVVNQQAKKLFKDYADKNNIKIQ